MKRKNEVINKRAAGTTPYICKEKFKNKYLQYKKYRKVRGDYHYTGGHKGVAHSIYNLKNSVSKKNLIVFHNVFNYIYLFIVK